MRWRIVAVVVALAILLAIPFSVGTYAVSTWSTALTFAVLAMSVNLLTGIAGLPTLGQAAYFGAGGYAAALVALNVSELGPVQLVAGGLVGAAFAAVTGPAAIRARGVAFLMITLAIGELAYVAAGQLTGITRGTDGISGIPAVVPLPGMAPLTNKGILYYYVLAVVVLVFIGIAVLLRSPFGASLRGLRDNEDRLRAVGYRTTAYAYGAYVIAGGIAGIGGSLLVTTERFIAPGDLGFDVAALALLAVILGGVGSMWGACFGAIVVIFVRDYVGSSLSGSLAGHGPLLLGILFVLVIYLLPRGISGGIRLRRRRHEPSAGDSEPDDRVTDEKRVGV